MNQDILLYTLPQWFIFAGVIGIAYGWIENKKIFRMIGCAFFLILGFYAIYAVSGGYFAAGKFLTMEEIAMEELDDEIIEEVPFAARLLPAYWSFIVSAVLAVPAIIFDWKNIKPTRLFIVLSGLVSLFGFFIIAGALKML